MTKFLVIVFAVLNGSQLEVVASKTVPTLNECIEMVVEINASKDNPYNAACFVKAEGPKT